MKTIKKIILILALIFCAVMACSAQAFWCEISEQTYSQILGRNLYNPATIILSDSSIHECFIEKYPDDDRIKIKQYEDSQPILMYHKYIISFTYHLDGNDFLCKFIDIDWRKNKIKIRPVEVIDTGRICVYSQLFVKTPDIEYLPYSKKLYYRIYRQFYLIKDDDVLYKIDDFSHDIRDFIKDNDDVYYLFKKNKIYKEDGFAAYLSIIKLYNMYEKRRNN